MLLTVNELGREAAGTRGAPPKGATSEVGRKRSIIPMKKRRLQRCGPSRGPAPPYDLLNRLAACRVSVDQMEELASDKRFVAIKESSDDIRRSTEIILTSAIYDCSGVDNRLRGASVGTHQLGGRTGHRVSARTVAIYQLMKRPPRGASLSLVPATARPRRVDLSGAEHQACRGLCDRYQRPRAHAAPAAVRRAAQGGRKDRQGRAGDAAGSAEILRSREKLIHRPS